MSSYIAILLFALDVTAPRLIHSAPPLFPTPPAIWDGVTECRVPVELTIERDGSVRDARLVDFPPRNRFARPALDSVRQWVFEPHDQVRKYQTVVVFSIQGIPNGGRSCNSGMSPNSSFKPTPLRGAA